MATGYDNAVIDTFARGIKLFELTNHLGNVLVTVSDKVIQHSSDNVTVDYNIADVVTANDYYPGGMHMPGRNYEQVNGVYRYSFNGQEKSDEIAPNTNTAQFWEYDSRIERRWNIDPKQKDWESPYLCFSGNPIWYSDALGDSGTPSKPLVPSVQDFKKQTLKQYQQDVTSTAERNKTNQKNAPPLVTFTMELTKGTYGIKTKKLGVGVGFTASDNETDIFGVRDNKNVNKKDQEYRNGMSASVGVGVIVPPIPIPIGVGTSSSLTVTSSQPMKNGAIPSTAVIEKKTAIGIAAISTVTQTTTQGKTIYTGSQIELFGYKGGYGLGYELSLDVNIPSNGVVPYPSFIWENPTDNTSVHMNPPVTIKRN